jgi:hypothetical protein
MTSGTARMRGNWTCAVFSENVKERDNFEVLGVDGTIFKCFFMWACGLDCLVGFWKMVIKLYTITGELLHEMRVISFAPWSL